MPDEPSHRTPTEDPPYRVYGPERGGGRKGGGSGGRTGGGSGDRPYPDGGGPAYKVYRSLPRGLRSRLRGEDDLAPGRGPRLPRRGGGLGAGAGLPWWRRQLRPRRLVLWVLGLIVAWLALSLVLFVISAQQQSGSIPASVSAALTPGGNMLTGTDTVLVIGTDQRPKGSKEPGAFAGGIRSDTMMLWRIGGGTSRRLSIPRDTVVPIPGYGTTKINAAYSYGGPALAIKTVENLTGVKINHVIIVNLANFPKFIDDIGGINVKTGRICSNISGGVKNGGFSLFLGPGVHHLDGRDALTLARTRENSCNAASNDLTREGYQQEILNSIKSQLLTPSTFFRLPWASWDAPQAVRTDMGGFTLLTLFAGAEMGGSAPTQILQQNHLPLPDVQSPSGQAAIHRAVNRLMNG
ncbi:MAG TPA: LCP family protein [Solirubrobacteraceae bacterium]|jgi:LCP family protein required for cell wall assembly|nr:LCP family protein [Solirubrobacteraceae bacterium]